MLKLTALIAAILAMICPALRNGRVILWAWRRKSGWAILVWFFVRLLHAQVTTPTVEVFAVNQQVCSELAEMLHQAADKCRPQIAVAAAAFPPETLLLFTVSYTDASGLAHTDQHEAQSDGTGFASWIYYPATDYETGTGTATVALVDPKAKARF